MPGQDNTCRSRAWRRRLGWVATSGGRPRDRGLAALALLGALLGLLGGGLLALPGGGLLALLALLTLLGGPGGGLLALLAADGALGAGDVAVLVEEGDEVRALDDAGLGDPLRPALRQPGLLARHAPHVASLDVVHEVLVALDASSCHRLGHGVPSVRVVAGASYKPRRGSQGLSTERAHSSTWHSDSASSGSPAQPPRRSTIRKAPWARSASSSAGKNCRCARRTTRVRRSPAGQSIDS